MSPGKQLRQHIKAHEPLQIVGCINAYSALLAEQVGFQAIYLSGAGVANACFGKPDIGLTTLEQVAEEARRICDISKLPLLVDADTGWNDPGETAHKIEQAGAAGLHIEDQIDAKLCGHLPGKQLVDATEMCDRIKAAVDARQDKDFVIMARTDAVGVEGFDDAIARANAYLAAGADMIFAEALRTVDEFKQFTQAIKAPVLANMTEFGKTPMLSKDEFASAGVAMILYPLSAFRAMNKAAEKTYRTILTTGSQKALVEQQEMQTREALYQTLGYSPDA